MKKTFTFMGLIGCLLVSFLVCNSNIDSKQQQLSSEQAAESAVIATALANSNQNLDNDAISTSRRNAITRAVEKVSPAVVGINVIQLREVRSNRYFNDPLLDYLFGGYRFRQKVQSLGSGFIISEDGYILTNEHVVQNAVEIVATLTGGKKYQAKIVGSDVTSDIALLKIEDTNLPFVKLGDSNDTIIGEWAIAFGNPFGLFDIGAEPSVSVGVISATNRDFERQDEHVYQDMIQTDAAINSGNSGGPLVNSNGEVIGINTFIYSGSNVVGTSIGLGFALPINRVKRILRDLKENGSVNRQFRTGLKIDNISQLHARFLGLASTSGVIVADVEKNSPAERANLEVGDVLIRVNGYQINTVEDIFEVIDRTDVKGGDVLTLTVLRRNRQFETYLKLERIP